MEEQKKEHVELRKVTILDFDRVYRRHGVLLLSGDLKEDWIEASTKMFKHRDEVYKPLMQKFEQKKQLNEGQQKRKDEVVKKMMELMQENDYHRLMYYANVRELIMGDTLENPKVQKEDLEAFAVMYELSMKQYFFENRKVKEEDAEEEGDKKKQKDRFGTLRSLLKK